MDRHAGRFGPKALPTAEPIRSSMDTGKGPDPTTKVCPRCGEDAREQRFCGGCGLNLSAQHEIPTRAEWEATQPTEAQAATPAQVSTTAHPAAEEAAAPAGERTPRKETPAPLPSWVPPGWYPDPLGLGAARHWNGTRWSSHYRDA